MNITKTLAVAGMMATIETSFAFAQTPTLSTYQADLQSARATLKTDTDRYNTDRSALRKAVKANDTATITTLKTTVAADKAKINADVKATEALKRAHRKEMEKKDKMKDDKKDDKMDKKDKNGKDIETKDDKMGTSTRKN